MINHTSSTIKKKTMDKTNLQKGLVKRMTKKFRDHLKVALKSDGRYKIVLAKFEKTKYSDVLLIDVVSVSGGETIFTYFTALLTKQIREYFKTEEIDPNLCSEILSGLCFIYKGETTSVEGNTYSDVEIYVAEERDDAFQYR